jgi:hypothetical protein
LGLHPEPLLFRHKNQTCLKSRFFTGDWQAVVELAEFGTQC